jgi:hypothetical protein
MSTRLANLSLGHISRCSPENELGWHTWVNDEAQVIGKLTRAAKLLAAEQISGVYLVGGCGMLPSLIPCGAKANGQQATTCWAGHSQGPMHELVYRFAELMPVVTSIGLPADFAGLNALRDECARIRGGKIELVFDASGANTDSRIDAVRELCTRTGTGHRLESRPVGAPTHADAMYATMPARVKALIPRGQRFAGDIVPFHSGTDANAMNETLAIMCENRGATVAQPLESFPEQA